MPQLGMVVSSRATGHLDNVGVDLLDRVDHVNTNADATQALVLALLVGAGLAQRPLRLDHAVAPVRPAAEPVGTGPAPDVGDLALDAAGGAHAGDEVGFD